MVCSFFNGERVYVLIIYALHSEKCDNTITSWSVSTEQGIILVPRFVKVIWRKFRSFFTRCLDKPDRRCQFQHCIFQTERLSMFCLTVWDKNPRREEFLCFYHLHVKTSRHWVGVAADDSQCVVQWVRADAFWPSEPSLSPMLERVRVQFPPGQGGEFSPVICGTDFQAGCRGFSPVTLVFSPPPHLPLS